MVFDIHKNSYTLCNDENAMTLSFAPFIFFLG